MERFQSKHLKGWQILKITVLQGEKSRVRTACPVEHRHQRLIVKPKHELGGY